MSTSEPFTTRARRGPVSGRCALVAHARRLAVGVRPSVPVRRNMTAAGAGDALDLAVRRAFDDAHYLAAYPDIADAGIHPFEHYMAHGWRERWRDPRPDLSTEAYLTAHPELVDGEVDPLTHWVGAGAPSLIGRRLTPGVGEADARAVREAFDDAHYLAAYPDIAEAGLDPFEHYMLHGWRERWRDPAPTFSTATYLDANPDIAVAGINPFVHWVLHGRAEGRRALPPGAGSYTAAASVFPALLRLEWWASRDAFADVLALELRRSERRVEESVAACRSLRETSALRERQAAAMESLLGEGAEKVAERP